MNQLYTPWRMEYIKRDRGHGGCVFCEIAALSGESSERQVIARSSHCFAVLNRYPYTYGHSMVVPYAHLSTPEDLPVEAQADISLMTNRLLRLLREIANPEGFNIGANIGPAAGASVAAHVHYHIVPRWTGDANFTATIGGIQTIADTLPNIQAQMREKWAELYGG